jgi:transposase-like protein
MSKLLSVDELFHGRHFDREVIILCVRWYEGNANGLW